MANTRVTLTGFKELQRAFKELEAVEARKAVRTALRDGAKVFAAEVKKDAPRGSGTLAKDVKVRAAPRKKGFIGVQVVIGAAGRGGRNYVGAVDLGTKAQRAQGFIERAFDDGTSRALDVTRRSVVDGITRALKG